MDKQTARMERKVRLCDVSSHIMCVLCGGYYIDATSIIECLHLFCRSCIVKYLETSTFCPICEVQLNKNNPLLSIRPDVELQRIVFKLVPGLYQRELDRIKEFHLNLPDDPANALSQYSKELDRFLRHHPPDDTVSVYLHYYDSQEKNENKSYDSGDLHEGEVLKKYIKFPINVNIKHLVKLIRMRYGLGSREVVEIYFEDVKIDEWTTILDVAYKYGWNREQPMKFAFKILLEGTIEETLPSSLNNAPLKECTQITKEVRLNCTEQSTVDLGRRKQTDSVANDTPAMSPPAKKMRIELPVGRRAPNVEDRSVSVSPIVVGKEIRESTQAGNETISDILGTSDSPPRGDQDARVQPPSQERMAENDKNVLHENMEIDEASPIADSMVNERTFLNGAKDMDVETGVVGDEPSQDFILQDQNMDLNDDLDEDDDEDRLRICDPEDIPEEKSGEDTQEDPVEQNSVKPKISEGKVYTFVEEESDRVRKEGKSRKKNKKTKHHHRHKRDYPPTPEAAIVSKDGNDNCMKLRVKLINNGESNQIKNKNKQGEKFHRSSEGQMSPKHSHRNFVIAQDGENSCTQSPSVSNADEDSRNSQSTDDHDVRSVGSSKEGQDEVVPSNGDHLLNGCDEVDKSKGRDLAHKEKLLQMRRVRHKNITPPPPRTLPTALVRKVEAHQRPPKSPLLLNSSSSSLTVSKVTAEEKMKMMTSSNLENNRPSLEIIMVNNPNAIPKTADNRLRESQPKQNSVEGNDNISPTVKVVKNNNINAYAQKQSALSVSKVKPKLDASSKVSDPDDKLGADKSRISEKRTETSGALDLSGKSARSSPASEGSNCPSPIHTLANSQPLLNRHMTVPMNSPHRSSPDSPKSSQNPMWNLMTLSDTAVHVQKMTAQDMMMKRQQMFNLKKPLGPQGMLRHPAASPPSRTPPPRASPTPLKIPTPGVAFASKFANNRPRAPTPLPNRMPEKQLVMKKSVGGVSRSYNPPEIRPHTTISYPNLMQSHSAAVAKKQAGINGRNPNIPPPPPAIPISTLYKMERFSAKYDIDKLVRGLSRANKDPAGIPS